MLFYVFPIINKISFKKIIVRRGFEPPPSIEDQNAQLSFSE